MKKSILLLSLLVTSFVFSQNVFWYDVLLEVDSKNASTVAELIDDFYSNHPKPSDVKVEFSSIQLKGGSEKATHMIGISSESSKSLANFRNSLKGSDWDLYISKMSSYVKSNRASAGKDLVTNGSKSEYPIGQAWLFKVKNNDLNPTIGAFEKFVKSTQFEGHVGMGQIVHGTENGEGIYIYATYSDLDQAFNFGPRNKKEAAAFSELFTALDASEYSKTFTRVLVKRY